MILSLIVAMSENRVIGADQKLPWHIPEDLKRFKALTLGHPVVMGRKTFESIGRLLPQRTNIVISRDPNWSFSGAVVAHSIEEALAPFRTTDQEVFIIGGGEIFKLTLAQCDRVYLTQIHREIPGNVFFPPLNRELFTEISVQDYSLPEPFSFIDLHKK